MFNSVCVAVLLLCASLNADPIHDAIRKNDAALVSRILAIQPEAVNASVSMNNETPLHYAVRSGNVPIMQLLLRKGADVNAASNAGVTPIFIAAAADGPQLFNLLIKQNADVSVHTRSFVSANKSYYPGTSLLHVPAATGNVVMMKTVLEAGGEADHADEIGLTPLMRFCTSANPNKLPGVTLLIDAGADVHAADKRKLTPLHFAAEAGDAVVIKALLNAGADPHAKDEKGRTPLDLAALKPHLAAMSQLKAAMAQPPASAE